MSVMNSRVCRYGKHPFLAAGSWYEPREDPADRELLVRRVIVIMDVEVGWIFSSMKKVILY
jgi:hypothetical protein